MYFFLFFNGGAKFIIHKDEFHMRPCRIRLALLPVRNAISQRASPSSMIRGRRLSLLTQSIQLWSSSPQLAPCSEEKNLLGMKYDPLIVDAKPPRYFENDLKLA